MKLLLSLSHPAQLLLQSLDPERAHAITVRTLSLLGNFSAQKIEDPRLEIEALGLKFPNPLGLAAGFDKNVETTEAMLSFGFGFVEAGTVTPKPQSGNPRPRIFRLREDRAVINRLGFNNEGLDAARKRLLALQGRPGIRGINIGANKDAADRIADYVTGLRELAPLADYVTVNISSPNTPGLRGLQNRAELDQLLGAVMKARSDLARRMPLLVKIAPDLDEQACADIAALALAHRIDGLIVSNTTIARPDSLQSPHRGEVGGLSGRPLFKPSTEILRTMRRLTKGKLVLIGVGGVSSGEDAWTKIRAGASLVQLYTALVYEGPALIGRIKRELLACMKRDNIKTIKDAIGLDA